MAAAVYCLVFTVTLWMMAAVSTSALLPSVDSSAFFNQLGQLALERIRSGAGGSGGG